jgi:hypothetical protein
VEITPDPRSFGVPVVVGDDGVRLPERFTARVHADAFVAVLQLEVVGETVELDELLVSRLPGHPPITAITLPNNLRISEVIPEAARKAAQWLEAEQAMRSRPIEDLEANPPVYPRDFFAVPGDRMAAIERAVPKRQQITTAFLRETVEAYRAALADPNDVDPYTTVGRQFGKSAKTAQRWMTLARKRGLLTEGEA